MISISTQAVSAALRQSVLRLQSDLAKSQKEVSTGRLADVGLSLGAGTGQSVMLYQEQSRLQAIQDTNNVVSTRLSSTQSALDGMLSTAQTFLSSLISNSGSANTQGTQPLQAQAQSGLQSLIGSLNTTVGGQYIFGGINTDVKPMADYFQQPSGAAKQAVDTAFQTAFGMSQTDPNASTITASAMQTFLGGSFATLFQGTDWTTNWSSASSQSIRSRISSSSDLVDTSVTANQPAFQKLAMAYTMVSELGSQSLSASASQAVISAASQAVSEAIQDLTQTQASLGTTQTAVTDASSQMSVQMTVLSTNIDSLETPDSYTVSTQVSNLQTQLEASYEITNKLQQLSLVNFLTTP